MIPRNPDARSVLMLGAGGNIGSAAVPLIARMPQVRKIILVDPDVYEPGNLAVQDIEARDVGRKKVDVQARRIHRIDASLEVLSLEDPVEALPPGMMRVDLILAFMDSRRARQTATRLALLLGVPWMDSGIEGDGLLARASFFFPSPGRACGCCSWDERHYAGLEVQHACMSDATSAATAPTGAPASLGALSASLLALHAQRYLAGEMGIEEFGREIIIDVSHRQLDGPRFERNPSCLEEHTPWTIERLERSAKELSVSDALDLAHGGSAQERELAVLRSPFIRMLVCPRCGGKRTLLRHAASISSASRRCRDCDRLMVAPAAAVEDALQAGRLPARTLRRSLASLGLRPGDIFTVRGSGRPRHFELPSS